MSHDFSFLFVFFYFACSWYVLPSYLKSSEKPDIKTALKPWQRQIFKNKRWFLEKSTTNYSRPDGQN